MGSTNKTANLELSQFLATDSPKWLTDYNADMEKIDVGYSGVKTQADATDLAVNGLTSTVTTLGESVSDQSTAIANLRTDVTSNTGSINTINSLIGNGEPTTTDKTIIGAINELAAEMPTPVTTVPASNVTYDNTTSGLTASNAQAAIDEVAADVTSKVSFEYVELASVTGDGVKTISQLLTDLDALMTTDKWNKVEYLIYGTERYLLRETSNFGSFISFYILGSNGELTISEIRVKTHVRMYGVLNTSGYTPTTSDTEVLASGRKIAIYGRP